MHKDLKQINEAYQENIASANAPGYGPQNGSPSTDGKINALASDIYNVTGKYYDEEEFANRVSALGQAAGGQNLNLETLKNEEQRVHFLRDLEEVGAAYEDQEVPPEPILDVFVKYGLVGQTEPFAPKVTKEDTDDVVDTISDATGSWFCGKKEISLYDLDKFLDHYGLTKYESVVRDQLIQNGHTIEENIIKGNKMKNYKDKNLNLMTEAYSNMVSEDKLTPETIAGLIETAINDPNGGTFGALVSALKVYTQVLDYPGIESVSTKIEFSAFDNIFNINLANGDYISYYYQSSEFGTHQHGTVQMNGQKQKFNIKNPHETGRSARRDGNVEKAYYSAAAEVLKSLINESPNNGHTVEENIIKRK